MNPPHVNPQGNTSFMKLTLIAVFAIFACLIDAYSQDVSYSGYLSEKISVSINANSIHDAVCSVIEQSKLKFPDMARINFAFNGPIRPSNQIVPYFKMEMIDISFGDVLRKLSRAFNQTLQYDCLRNTIVFTTVTSTGDDPSRKYHISNAVSAKLGIIWDSEYKFIESLQKYPIITNFSEIDLTNKTFVATGNISGLEYIDRLLLVGAEEVSVVRPRSDKK